MATPSNEAKPIFRVSNHHVKVSGVYPPSVDDAERDWVRACVRLVL
jgi:hypothetical protein